MNKKVGAASGTTAILLAYAISNAILQTPKLVDLINENKEFDYEVVDSTYVVPSGQVKYSVVSTWLLVEVKGNDGLNKLRIVNEEGIDVLTDEVVTTIHRLEDSYISLDTDVLNLESLSTYLVDDEVKELYSPDDIENLISLISAHYNWHKDKTLKIAY